jgi:hypothetical protein
MKISLICLLSLALQSSPIFGESLLSELYPKSHLAQDSGTYSELLNGLRKKASTRESIRSEIIRELRKLQKLDGSKREKQASELLFHYSKTHTKYKKTPLALDEKIGVSASDFQAGKFDPEKVTDNLLRATADYEKNVLIPMYKQIEKEIVRDFSDREILFLGRDFTPPQLFIQARNSVDPDKLHMANVSRAVMKEIQQDKIKPFWKLMDQIGLSREEMIRNGVLILDSSMTGDVPAAVLKGLVSGIENEKDLYKFLSKSHVRFIESDNNGGRPIGKAVKEAARDGHRISQKDALRLVSNLTGIDTFDYRIPKGLEKFEGHAHNLIEHRPKFLTSPSGFSSTSSETRLVSPEPEGPGERVKSLLGLHADLELLNDKESCAGLKKVP